MPSLISNTLSRAGRAWKELTSTAGSYDVAEQRNKHRPAPLRQQHGEDAILDKTRRSRAIGTSRQTARNFAIAGWMVRKHLDYVTAFDLHVRTASKSFNEELEGQVKEWMRPANCDAARLHHFPRLLRIAEGRRVQDGDVGLLKLRSLHLQGIESDLIRDPPVLAGRRDQERWNHGVKKGPGERHLAYALWKRGGKGRGYEFERTVSSGNLLLHGFFEYFGQSRGISPINAALNTLGDVKTNFDLALTKAKVSQLIAFAIQREAGEGYAEKEENGRYKIDFGGGPVFLDLDEGDDAKFIESNQPSSEFQNFTTLSIAVALKALDIPYSFYDESFTNFFGSRAAWQHYERSCVAKRLDVADLLRRIAVWLFAEWIIAGRLTLPRGLTLATLPFEWVPRGMPWWKPGEEIRADLEAIRGGLTTPQTVCRERGRGDFFDNIDQIAAAAEYARDKQVALSWVPAAADAESGSAADGQQLVDRLGAVETALESMREQGVLDECE